MDDLGSKISECFSALPVWSVGAGGKFRIFLPTTTPLSQVLDLRRWLMEKGHMGPDSGFVIKQDGDSAFLVAHLDTAGLL